MNRPLPIRRPKVLVAGATGYIGGGVLEAARRAGLPTRALARDPSRLGVPCDDVFVGHATQKPSLEGMCEGVDVVFSSIGVHSFDARPTIWEVDLEANLNILDVARREGVKHVVFVSVVRCEEMARLSPIAEARRRVAEAIKDSGLGYTIYEPTGFFNDMKELYDAAHKRGSIAVFGEGTGSINPLSAVDLGEEIVARLAASPLEALGNAVKPVGGPETFTHQEAAELVFEVLEKPVRTHHVPPWAMKWIAHGVRPFNENVYGLLRFFEFCAREPNMCGEPIGRRKLSLFYRNLRAGMSLRDADRCAKTTRSSMLPPRAA